MLKNGLQSFAFKIKFVHEMLAVSTELRNKQFRLAQVFREVKYAFWS